MTGLRIASIGECMIELNQRAPASFALAYGGDTLNTAVYLARVNPRARLAVDYVTALGDDPYSEAMIAMWRREGVGTEQVSRLPGKLPGLYLIRLDEKGERRFFYYRSAAAVRELFSDPSTLPRLAALPEYDLVYFSAVTLSVLSDAARQRLFEALDAVRKAGRRVAFDSNYRPAGWPDAETARQVIGGFLARVDIALPTFEDEARLFGDPDPAATADRYAARGVGEVAIKLGGAGALIASAAARRVLPVPEPVEPVDTTAAGDAFNAGYLSFRLAGRAAAEAAFAGHLLAAAVIRHPGAIVPRAAMPDLGL
ncbi:MAG: sugar kinase [Alphaproteobacteria bacterium]|nr:sugar kinase [Alphaproteobacteria bacterium]